MSARTFVVAIHKSCRGGAYNGYLPFNDFLHGVLIDGFVGSHKNDQLPCNLGQNYI